MISNVTNKPINDILYEALRLYAMRTGGAPPVSVSIVFRYPNGATGTLDIPRSSFRQSLPMVDDDPDEEQDPPPANGWKITHEAAWYNGTELDFGNRSRPCLSILRAIVCAGGEGVPLEDLKGEAWPGYEPEVKTIANTLSVLRSAIRAACQCDCDPVIDSGGKLRINIS